MDERRTVDQEILDDIIRRIVEVAHPEKIILFGSAARGEMGPNSDVDLLIIKEGADALDLMAQIYRNLHGAGARWMRLWSRLRMWSVSKIATRLSSSPPCERER